MKFKTKISKTENGKHQIFGKDVLELMQKHTFTETIFLLLNGSLPNTKQTELLDAVLVACTENGIEAPSIFVPRVVSASGNNFQSALASGMLAIGEKHGGAAEAAAKLFSSGKTAAEIVEQNKIVPGFGHKIYKDQDPRAELLFKKTQDLGFSGKYFNLAKDIQKEISNSRGKQLPLNIDGALACVLLELGFSLNLGKALFLIGRIVGMSAHILEELEQNNSYYRLDEAEITYEK
jgi:citryl-CoA lyase